MYIFTDGVDFHVYLIALLALACRPLGRAAHRCISVFGVVTALVLLRDYHYAALVDWLVAHALPLSYALRAVRLLLSNGQITHCLH